MQHNLEDQGQQVVHELQTEIAATQTDLQDSVASLNEHNYGSNDHHLDYDENLDYQLTSGQDPAETTAKTASADSARPDKSGADKEQAVRSDMADSYADEPVLNDDHLTGSQHGIDKKQSNQA